MKISDNIAREMTILSTVNNSSNGKTFLPTACKVKQASHWHEFCSRNSPQYGVPSRAILVTRSLSRRQGDASFAPCRAISYELFTKCVTHVYNDESLTPYKTIFEHFKIFATTWHALLHLTGIATHSYAHCHEFFRHWHAKPRFIA